MAVRDLNVALVLRLVDRLSGPARAAARNIGAIANAEKLAKKAGDQWQKGIVQLDRGLDRLAKGALVTEGLGRAGASLSRPLISATRDAARFGQGLTGIGITAQLTDAQLRPLRASILATSRDLKLSASTVQGTYGAVLAEGVYNSLSDLSKAGAAVAKFQKLAEVMADPISNEEAGALSAAFGSTFKLRADQLDKASAMISKSAKAGGVGIGALAKALPAQAGSLRGLSFANDVGLADLLAANQIAKRLAGSSDMATNNVTNLFAALANQQTIKNFREMGINIEAEIKKGVKRGVSPLETVATVAYRKSKGDLFRIGEIFGDRQARDAAVAIVQNLDDFRRMSREIQSADALPQYLADVRRATSNTAASFAGYTAAAERMGIATGTILAPAAGLAANLLEKVANWMSKAEESSNPLARAAVFAAAGFAAFAVSAGAIGNAVVGVLGPMLILRTLFGALGGAAVLGAAANVLRFAGIVTGALRVLSIGLLTTPAGWIILGIAAAAAAAAVLIRRYWGPISAFMRGVLQGVGAAFAPLGAALRPLKPLWDGIVGGVRAAWSWFSRLVAPVKASQAQLDAATAAGRRLGEGIAAGVRLAATVVGAILNPGGLLARLGPQFAEVGVALMKGLARGVSAGVGAVKAAVANAAASAVERFKGLLGIKSPSRVFAGLGGDAMAGLALGLRAGRRAPLAHVAGLAAGITAAMSPIGGPGSGLAPAGLVPAAGFTRGALAAGDGPAAPAAPVAQRVEQHFHGPWGSTDPKALARELARLGRQGQRAALNDGDER